MHFVPECADPPRTGAQPSVGPESKSVTRGFGGARNRLEWTSRDFSGRHDCRGSRSAGGRAPRPSLEKRCDRPPVPLINAVQNADRRASGAAAPSAAQF